MDTSENDNILKAIGKRIHYKYHCAIKTFCAMINLSKEA